MVDALFTTGRAAAGTQKLTVASATVIAAGSALVIA
jgi:hypothetical protein